MATNQMKAYQSAQKQQKMTPRQAEAMAFIKAAVMMEEAKSKYKDKDLLMQALRFNQLFWTILQADIADPENQLPGAIKANIMSLSLFVDKQVKKVIQSGDPADLDILISINRNLAAGLNEPPAGAEAPAATPDQTPAGGTTTTSTTV